MINDDMELVRDYAAHQSEPAFETLVARHAGLVHSAALRHVRDPHLAGEITQTVFIILARKAGSLNSKVILPGWLYRTTRYAASAALKMQRRREQREQEACMQARLHEAQQTNAVWDELSPLLDEAMTQLRDKDHDAIVLRYFQNQNLTQVGAALGVDEYAAQKRVSRALEKLRKFFIKRGVSSTTALIAGAISANSVQAVPVELAKTVAVAGLNEGAATSTSTLILIKGALKLMAWQKMKLALAIGAVVLVAAAATAYAARHGSDFSISYQKADAVWQWFDSVDKSKLIVQASLTSNNNAAKPPDIQITIQSAIKGPIPVPLGSNGVVKGFPHDDALHRENPMVTFDHIKGCNLTVWAYMPVPEDKIFTYDRLGDAVEEANHLIARADTIVRPSIVGWGSYLAWRWSPSSPRKMRFHTMIFEFPKSSARTATVEIKTAAGAKTYKADADGLVKLKLDKQLLIEDPEVQTSEKPNAMVPYF